MVCAVSCGLCRARTALRCWLFSRPLRISLAAVEQAAGRALRLEKLSHEFVLVFKHSLSGLNSMKKLFFAATVLAASTAFAFSVSQRPAESSTACCSACAVLDCCDDICDCDNGPCICDGGCCDMAASVCTDGCCTKQ